MTSKHTPGPWRVEQDTTLVWGACDADDISTYGMGYPIADCRITPTASWAKGPDNDQGEANARLIAAAPEMLAALKHISVAMSGGCLEAISKAWKVVDAAIAKAEGQS